MNREICRLRRDLEKGPGKGCQAFDRYAFNAFSWQAKYWVYHGRTEEERQEAERLRKLAVDKSNSFKEQEG